MNTTANNRKQLLQLIGGDVPAAEKRFDSDTGRFLEPDGGWAVTHQDVIFPLALLLKTAGSGYEGSPKLLHLCREGGDALRDWQDNKGQFEFIKIDGSRWGKIYMPWTIYHWLEAFVLLHDELEPGRRRDWQKGLTLAHTGLARILSEGNSTHNIPTWQGMSLARAAQIFDEPRWAQIARSQVQRTASAQHADGYWIEGDGPTTGYNLTYLHSLSLYETFTGDRSVLPALRRAIAFHTAFSYPDGTSVETVDGRQKFHSCPNVFGWPGLMREARGRGLVLQMIQTLRRIFSNGRSSHPHLGVPPPHLASAWQHWPEGSIEPLPQSKESYRQVYRRRALIRREKQWFFCISGYAARPQARPALSRQRFILSRNNCLSIWHKRLGLLVGGGNSKHDPRFATFELWRDGAWHVEPDKVSFSQSKGIETARFFFGDLSCLLRAQVDDTEALRLTFEVPAATAKRATVRAGMSIRTQPGTRLRWELFGQNGDKGRTTLGAATSFNLAVPADGRIDHAQVSARGWSLTLPPGSNLTYPVYPYNPYAINDASSPTEATTNVFVDFAHTRRQTLVFRAGES